jgi:hypothetical protein
MPDLPQNPPRDSARESLIVTIILRTGLVLLGAFISVLLFVVGYGITLYIFGQTELFEEYSSEYLLLSMVCGAGTGLFLPMDSIAGTFERLIDFFGARRQGAWMRAVMVLLGFLVFIILYWYFLTIAIAVGAAVADLF